MKSATMNSSLKSRSTAVAKATQSSDKFASNASALPAIQIGHMKKVLPGSFSSHRNVSVAAKHRENSEPRALSGDMVSLGKLLETVLENLIFHQKLGGGSARKLPH